MYKTIRVHKHERGLWFRDEDFHRLVPPGEYRLWRWPFGRHTERIDAIDALMLRFEHPLLEVIVQDETAKQALEIIDLADDERALVWRQGRLEMILGAGLHALWKGAHDLVVERFSTGSFRFEHERFDTVLAHSDAGRWFRALVVEPEEEVLLFRNGELVDRLGAGRYAFWRGAGSVEWKAVDGREQTLDVAGQEIMTSDKVSLRVNLCVTYRVVDALQSVRVVNDHAQALYREAQLALRAAIGTRTLDALLGNKEALGPEIRSALAERAGEFGVAVASVGLRDVILPGDMRQILNQVVEAEKAAQANLIRRREETAAARSQANTARLLADNPALARIKELELLGEILSGVDAKFVLGSGDLVGQLRSLLTTGGVSDTSVGS